MSRVRFLLRRRQEKRDWRVRRSRQQCLQAMLEALHPLQTLACVGRPPPDGPARRTVPLTPPARAVAALGQAYTARAEPEVAQHMLAALDHPHPEIRASAQLLTT